MRFYEYQDIWSGIKLSGLAKHKGWIDRGQMYAYLSRRMTDQLSRRHLYFDMLWHRNQCPYYDVYPSIIPMLTKIDLDIAGTHIIDTFISHKNEFDRLLSEVNNQISHAGGKVDWIDLDYKINDYISQTAFLPHLLIRLPECGHPIRFVDPTHGTINVKSIFISFQPVNMKCVPPNKDELIPGITIGIDIGEKVEGGMEGPTPTYLINCIPLNDKSLEDTMNLLPEHGSAQEGIHIPKSIIIDCVKLCLTIRLIKDDPELIHPDVLSKDRARYEAADDILKAALISKAIRRGKHGYRIGHLLEQKAMMPHLRRPHPALVWTGEGRKIPRIVMRKGSVVHRDKVNQIPTGYMNK